MDKLLSVTRKRQREFNSKEDDTDFAKLLFFFKKNIKKGIYTDCVEFLRGFAVSKEIARELNDIFKTTSFCLLGMDSSIALRVVTSRDENFQQSIASRALVKQQTGGTTTSDSLISASVNLNNFYEKVANSVGVVDHKLYHIFIEMIQSVWKCFAGVKHATEANGVSNDRIVMSFSVERIFSNELLNFMDIASKFDFEVSIGKANTLLIEIIYKY
jgi:hypothetical protein